jgi:glycosyltransferase involved in cell wall biosynthesis
MAKNLKIIHFIYDDIENPWLGGGGARRTFEIYSRFPESYSITVITGKYPGALSNEKITNITYRRIGLPFGYLISRLSYSLLAPFYILFHHFDVLIEDYSAFSPCFSFFFTTKTVIGSFQNLHSQKSAKGKGLLKSIGADIFDRIALRFFKNITAVSPDLTKIMHERARHKNNISFIGVGIDQALFSIERSTSTPRHILYIGRIEIYQKGLDILLQAYSQLSDAPQMAFAGSGTDVEKIKAIIDKYNLSQHIIFAGRFSQEQKRLLLQNALFVIMPSRFEGFPVVPLEAMASGNAFIGTNIPGTKDIVGNNGILTESENTYQLAEAMKVFISDQKQREGFEIKGKEYAKKYQWESISKEFLDFIHHSLKQTSNYDN